MIRRVVPADAKAISSIYNYYVNNTEISFEEKPVSINEMEKRIRETTAEYPWFVAEKEGSILGYAYTNKYRERSAYRYTAELTVYIKNGEEGKGLGAELMGRVIEETRKKGVHTLISAIAIPNERSVTIHEKFGFEKVGHLKDVGFKLDRWIDVGYWELVLTK
jgi:phosphinothricin acetyltransferase